MRVNLSLLCAVVGAALYPHLLWLSHSGILAASGAGLLGGAAALAGALAVPVLGIAALLRIEPRSTPSTTWQRRLALCVVAAPPAFVFLGVLQGLIGSEASDTFLWTLFWIVAAPIAFLPQQPRQAATAVAPDEPRAGLRIAHGIGGAIAALFILFHLANHLMGLLGPAAHTHMMDAGRTIYRSPLVEPLLVAVMLFQVAGGVALARRWSRLPMDPLRSVQVATGAYLAVFILGHMNSVFIYARWTLGIDTGWGFATGAPTGLLADAWNIRLVPHYAFGVVFALSHLASGARVILLAHGARRRTGTYVWAGGTAVAATIAAAVIAGMCGVRL